MTPAARESGNEPRAAPAAGRALLLTPPQAAAIAVVRLAGPGVDTFLQQHFSRPVPPGRCVRGDITDGGRRIDDALVVRSQRAADLNLHGGPWVVHSVLELAVRFGFERVPSSLPLAAEAVDGEGLLESEILAHLPLARTEPALRTLLSQGAAWCRLGEEAARAAGGDEAAKQAWAQRIHVILEDASLRWMLGLPRVAIIGAANVGKSTLANQLFGQERSITADLPGTTRDWVGEVANLDGLAVLLVDTPGQRPTADPVERLAMARSRDQVEAADLVVLVLDASAPLEGTQSELLLLHPDALRVINKSDCPAAWELGSVQGLPAVATTGEGLDALRAEIRCRFACEGIDPQQPRCWTDRQRELLRQARIEPLALVRGGSTQGSLADKD